MKKTVLLMLTIMVLLFGVMAAPPSIAAAEDVVFDNENISTVANGPVSSTQFTIREPHMITFLRTYHWNSQQGSPAGTIGLRHSDGTMYGPWQAKGITGYRDVPNAYWGVEPNVTIKAGTYTIVDSKPSTWSHNSESEGSGFAVVKGYKTDSAPVSAASYDLTGKWNITANRSRGTFEITSQSGSTFSGTVHIDTGRTEKLVNGGINGNTVTFTRMWNSGSLRQDYTGTLSVDANGNAMISGTFTQNGASSYSWSATKATPISLPVTPAPTKPAPTTPATPAAPTGSGAEAFESGSRIMWQPASGLGYRLFRSTSQNSLGISVTDFYITSTSFADVNLEPNTTYYYTVKPVLAEARPFEGIAEKLGATIATFTVRTGGQIYKPNSFKHFILLKLGSPYMSVDGSSQEIDPGRGTEPLIISGRTMVPIRAVVEAMGGTVEWNGGTQKITLDARGNKVEMWLGKTNIQINGVARKMDVAPLSHQGRTFVPLRFAAENLNCKVDWINSTKEAVIVYEE